MEDYEKQGSGYDSGATGHELQGRSNKPNAPVRFKRDTVEYNLTSVKGDREIADELRVKFFDALKPVCGLIAESEKNGFEVGFSFAKDAFNNTTIASINLMKKY
jgi:hypothetical protein